jgi:hypothetical protein
MWWEANMASITCNDYWKTGTTATGTDVPTLLSPLAEAFAKLSDTIRIKVYEQWQQWQQWQTTATVTTATTFPRFWKTCNETTTSDSWGNAYSRYITCDWRIAAPVPISERLRQIMSDRQGPAIIIARKPIQPPTDARELRARETLRRLIGEDGYRGFLKNGFVSVRGSSGKIYQLFPGHQFTRVFKDGERLEDLCIVLKEQYPPTDSLLMRYVILLNDEARFAKIANRHPAYAASRQVERIIDSRSLPAILSEMRQKHGVPIGMSIVPEHRIRLSA